MEVFKEQYKIGANTYTVRLLEDLNRTPTGRIQGVSGFAEKHRGIDQYTTIPRKNDYLIEIESKHHPKLYVSIIFNEDGEFQGGKFYTGTTNTAGPLIPAVAKKIIEKRHGEILEIIAAKLPSDITYRIMDFYITNEEDLLRKYMKSKAAARELDEKNLNN
jgi:hypothetical protein